MADFYKKMADATKTRSERIVIIPAIVVRLPSKLVRTR